MLKNKKIFWGILFFLVFVIFITWILGEEKEYVGKITTDELEVISYEVRKKLPEEYKLTQAGRSFSRQKIMLQFENYKGLEIRFKVKRICMQSDTIKKILDKYQIKGYEVMDLFIIREGGPAVLE